MSAEHARVEIAWLVGLVAVVSACQGAVTGPPPPRAHTPAVAAPEPETEEPDAADPNALRGLVIDVPADGDVQVAGSAVSEARLREHLATNSGDAPAILRAADAVSWHRIVSVVDALRLSARNDFVLAARDSKRRTAVLRFPKVGDLPWAPPPAPDAPGAAIAPGDVVLVASVEITRDGTQFVDGSAVRGSLRESLHLAMANGAQRVIIHGDRDARFGAILDAVLDAQAEGATIAFAVSPAPPSPDAAAQSAVGGVTASPATPASGGSPKPSLRPGGFPKCDFPAQADKDAIDSAVVVLRVRVDAAGKVTDVSVLSDPGHGFGEAAKKCAKKAGFDAARDAKGKAVASELVMRVRFER